MAGRAENNGEGVLKRAGGFLAARPLLSTVVAVALLLVLYLRVALPLHRHVQDLRDRTDRQYEMAMTSGQLLEKLKGELARERAAKEDLDRMAGKAWDLAPGPAVDRLKALAGEALRGRGLVIERVTPLKPEKSGRFQVVRVQFVATGDMDQIKDLLGFVRERDDFVFISAYKLSPHDQQDGMLVLDLTCAALLAGGKKG